MVKKHRCSLCGNGLPATPILTLDNMPSSAQEFLTNKNQKTEPITLDIYKCLNCGLIQHKFKPVSYYKKVITAAGLSEATLKFRESKLKELIYQHNILGSVLDIGSGDGKMLNVLRNLYLVDVYGLEFGSKKAIPDYILDFETTARFNLIVSYNYLEHLPKINKVVKKIYSLLTDCGIGYFTVPNVDYLLDTGSCHEFVRDHLNYFDVNSLRLLFETNGFEVLNTEIINNENDIAITVRKRQHVDLSESLSGVFELAHEIKNTIDEYGDVAIFGAGHRTLALLSIGKITDIKYIVDSYVSKQNKYTPVTKIPIYAPEHLLNYPVNLLIIAVPGIYSIDVIKKVKALGLKVKIGIIEHNKLKIQEDIC